MSTVEDYPAEGQYAEPEWFSRDELDLLYETVGMATWGEYRGRYVRLYAKLGRLREGKQS